MCDSPNWVVDVDDGSSDAGQGTCHSPSARRGTAVSRSGNQPSASGQASAREQQRGDAGEQALGDAACSNHDGEKDLGVSDTSLCPEYPAGLPCKVSPPEGCRAKQQQHNLWPDTCRALEADQTWWSVHAGDWLLNPTLFLLFWVQACNPRLACGGLQSCTSALCAPWRSWVEHRRRRPRYAWVASGQLQEQMRLSTQPARSTTQSACQRR